MDKHDRKVSVTMFYCVGLYGYVPTHGIDRLNALYRIVNQCTKRGYLSLMNYTVASTDKQSY
jgi:hypothetical protein